MESPHDQIHLFDHYEPNIYLTREDYESVSQEKDCSRLEMESKQYQKGYENAVANFKRRFNLRNKNVGVNTNIPFVDHPTTS